MMTRFIDLRFLYALLQLGLLLGMSSCSLYRLNVQTQYLSHENLASYHVGTPDPSLDHPRVGQRLFIQWSLSKQEIQQQPLTLHLSVRFRNRQETQVAAPIHQRRGYYIYEVVNQQYRETGGILTYYVEVRHGTCLLASWKHPLWVPLINFPQNQE